ncbi:MAG TPA: hypothetical protein VEK57_16930 [Thermoanaerobaculia bacterium]|nr:hypothetical protein [Thermoanaerobaculia bacterium]
MTPRNSAATALAVLLIAGAASAQTPDSSRGKGGDPLDNAKTSWYYDRYLDEVWAKKAMEQTHVALRTAEFREALRNFDSSALPRLPLTYDQFLTATETVFHAMQVGLPGGAQKKVTFFGEILDENGKVLADFEERTSVVESKDDRLVERAFLLPAKPAVATLGIAVGREIIGLARVTIGDEAAAAPKTTAVSRLLVSNNVYNLDKQQKPFEPFAFGGTKVVPKPDRSFRRSDEVWLFTEIRNPSLGDGNAPRLTMHVEIDGNGKKVRIPATAAEASPLKGVPDHYGVGTTINVASLQPGQYQLKFTLVDAVTKQAYEREQTITIVE